MGKEKTRAEARGDRWSVSDLTESLGRAGERSIGRRDRSQPGAREDASFHTYRRAGVRLEVGHGHVRRVMVDDIMQCLPLVCRRCRRSGLDLVATLDDVLGREDGRHKAIARKGVSFRQSVERERVDVALHVVARASVFLHGGLHRVLVAAAAHNVRVGGVGKHCHRRGRDERRDGRNGA